MTEKPGEEKQRVVVELLVLAIGRSPLKEVVGLELVRSALEIEIDHLVVDGRVDLDVAWKTVHQLPGFDAKSAAPPFCWFKTLEPRLGLVVTLPEELQKLSTLERRSLVAMCPVKPKEIDHVLEGKPAPAPGEITAPIVMEVEEATKKKPTRPPVADGEDEQRPRRITGPPPKPSAKPEARSPRRKAIGLAAALIALGSAIFVSITLVNSCDKSADWVAFEQSDLAGLPVKRAEKLGTQVGATLTDAGWMSRPEAERRGQLEDVLRRIQRKQVSVLFIKDETGQVRASAQWLGKDVVVRFY